MRTKKETADIPQQRYNTEYIAQHFYSRAQARRRLGGMSDDQFQYQVNIGHIKGIKLPNKRQSLYPKHVIDALADQVDLAIEAALLAANPGQVFRPATAGDIDEEIALTYLLFGNPAHQEFVRNHRNAYLEKNPEYDWHLYDEGSLVSFINLIPYTSEAIERFKAGEWNWKFEPETVLPFEANKPLECVIADMVTTPTVPPHKRAAYAQYTILKLMKFLEELGKRSVRIEKIYAGSHTESGMKIIKSAGFQMLRERPNGGYVYVLDVLASPLPIYRRYQQYFQ